MFVLTKKIKYFFSLIFSSVTVLLIGFFSFGKNDSNLFFIPGEIEKANADVPIGGDGCGGDGGGGGGDCGSDCD